MHGKITLAPQKAYMFVKRKFTLHCDANSNEHNAFWTLICKGQYTQFLKLYLEHHQNIHQSRKTALIQYLIFSLKKVNGNDSLIFHEYK